MLYQVTVIPYGRLSRKYVERIVEAPPYTTFMGGGVALPDGLDVWASKLGFEQSVIWGFKEVQVSVARYFPMRLGFTQDNGSAVSSVLREWTCKAEKRVAS